MSTQRRKFSVSGAVPIDVPDKRDYESEATAEVDRSLMDAIEAADAADNEYLRELLATELGSHYYDTR